MKRVIIILIAALSTLSLAAQNEDDALRYSQSLFGGTARYISVGGAMGALGGDFSTLSSNPAGIGVFKKSDVTFSTSIFWNNTYATIDDETKFEQKSSFNIDNAGLIFDVGENNIFKNFNIGFGVNKLNNFNGRTFSVYDNPDNSLMDAYINDANGNVVGDLSMFGAGLAYQTYLLDLEPGFTDRYTSPVPPGGIRQEEYKITKGTQNEFVFSLGGNWEDKIFFGATVGIPYFNYTEETTYKEYDNGDSIVGFNDFRRDMELNADGIGINLKLGMIFKPVSFISIGAAFHTPTAYAINEIFDVQMRSDLDSNKIYDDSYNGFGEYNLTTPLKAIGSFAITLGPIGFLSAEYEYIDYSKNRLSSYEYNFNSENETIGDIYKPTYNLKFGAEFRLAVFTFRGGYAIYGNPYVNNTDGDNNIWTAGIGIKGALAYFDVAYMHSSSNTSYYYYNGVGTDVDINNNKNKVVCTLGIKIP